MCPDSVPCLVQLSTNFCFYQVDTRTKGRWKEKEKVLCLKELIGWKVRGEECGSNPTGNLELFKK